ncbi:nucleotidyltransferase family protein [Sinomonas terrae]|uniref:Nucleotidyltransferase family protein n=1 Tax=Sinomonas terrae TaxID=2908838 RepID=A0ABS9TY53_9MICC|nr:nucleotidyltransferase family protein [Sinomonas terrae]MCH6469398.1 nucleotidyltransferase family protein [Sinomonas terrae]
MGGLETEAHPNRGTPLVDLPLSDRIQLAHALVEWLSAEAGIDLLHIKGYAADRRLYAVGRASSDVDVLVRPAHAGRLAEILVAHGWEVTTTFRSGSVFHHAMTLWSEHWGHVDIHRSFPGVGLAPEDFFERLWTRRGESPIAAWPCRVPAFEDQALLIVLHAARDPHRGSADVETVREAVGPRRWAELESAARACEAGVSWAAATGRLDDWQGHPERAVWEVVSRGGSRVELFRARWRASRGQAERWELLRSLLLINGDHLRMKLLREPRPADYARELRSRAADVARSVLAPRRRR